MSVVRANQRCRNLATSLSPESTRSIMIISGEPAATDYHSPAGPGTYVARFFSFLDRGAAHRRLRQQCGQFRRSLLCTMDAPSGLLQSCLRDPRIGKQETVVLCRRRPTCVGKAQISINYISSAENK